MAQEPDLLLVGADGAAFMAALGETGPTNFDPLPEPAWGDMGYISDDGIKEALAEDRKDWVPWGQLEAARSEITKHEKSFEVTFWETNKNVLSVWEKQDVAAFDPDPVTGIITFDDNITSKPDPRAWVFDVLDGTNLMRFYVPKGEVTNRGDIIYKQQELIGRPCTITARRSGAFSIRRFMKLDAITS